MVVGTGVTLLILVVLFVVAILTRLRTPRPNLLRQKPGESESEARLILLGTYRFYSWTLLAAVVLAILLPVGDRIGSWLGELMAVVGIAVMLMSHAVYWRLGYGWQRVIFALGHASVLFGLMECYGPLGREVQAHAFTGEPPTPGK